MNVRGKNCHLQAGMTAQSSFVASRVTIAAGFFQKMGEGRSGALPGLPSNARKLFRIDQVHRPSSTSLPQQRSVVRRCMISSVRYLVLSIFTRRMTPQLRRKKDTMSHPPGQTYKVQQDSQWQIEDLRDLDDFYPLVTNVAANPLWIEGLIAVSCKRQITPNYGQPVSIAFVQHFPCQSYLTLTYP